MLFVIELYPVKFYNVDVYLSYFYNTTKQQKLAIYPIREPYHYFIDYSSSVFIYFKFRCFDVHTLS